VQVCLSSATMPKEILEITDRFMRDPVRILVKAQDLTLDGLKQFFIDVGEPRYKLDTLMDLYECVSVQQCIIFCNRRQTVDWLSDKMVQNDFSVDVIHGGLSMDDRKLRMANFRSGASRVLISTDLLARGIDVNSVSLVINYDLPLNRENYIHRIGRSARYGKKGVAINFVTPGDASILQGLEQFYNTTIEELPADFAESVF